MSPSPPVFSFMSPSFSLSSRQRHQHNFLSLQIRLNRPQPASNIGFMTYEYIFVYEIFVWVPFSGLLRGHRWKKSFFCKCAHNKKGIFLQRSYEKYLGTFTLCDLHNYYTCLFFVHDKLSICDKCSDILLNHWLYVIQFFYYSFLN